MRETTKKAKEIAERIMYPLKTKKEILELYDEVGKFFESGPPASDAAIISDVSETLLNIKIAIDEGYWDDIGDDEKWWKIHRDELIDDEDDDEE